MPTRRCCCGNADCKIGTDDFNRIDANPPSGNWSVISGEWEISSNRLRCVSEGPLITTLRQIPPIRAGAGYNVWFSVGLVMPLAGTASFKVICAYTGPTEFKWVQLDYDASTGIMKPTFYVRSGSDTIIADETTHPAGEFWSITPGIEFRFKFCCSNLEWVVSGDGDQDDVIWHICEPCGLSNLTSPNGGVGFLGEAGTEYDNWDYYIHWESQINCEYCQCLCLTETDSDDYKCLPDTLYITLTSTNPSFNCPCVDGLTLEMYNSDPDVSGASPIYEKSARKNLWFSQVFNLDPSGPTSTPCFDYIRAWFIFTCTTGTRSQLSLVQYPSKNPGDTIGEVLTLAPRTWSEPANSCNPISIVFNGINTFITTCPVSGESRPTICDINECAPDGSFTPPQWIATVTE